MKNAIGIVFALLLIGGVAWAGAAQFDLTASSWILDWSAGVPALENVRSPAGTKFLRVHFPNGPGHINELTVAPPSNVMAGKSTMAMNLIVQSTNAAWGWPNDGCQTPYPTYAHFFFQRIGDDWLGTQGTTEFYRWWSQAIPLQPIGLQKIRAALTPDKWTSVLGKPGTANVGMFNAAMGNVSRVGLTFGGGCAFAHGIWLNGGSAYMTIRYFWLE